MSSTLCPGTVVSGDEVSQTERTMCVDLAAAYWLAALNGWDDLVYVHLSTTVSGETDHFLINAFNLTFDEVTVFNLVRINGRDQLVGDWPEDAARPFVNVTGFALRATAYATRPDAQYMIHLHNTADIAVSTQKHGLPPLPQHALRFRRRIAYHDYEGLAFISGEGMRLATSLGNHFAILPHNHGTLTVGHIVARAHISITVLIKAYGIQIQARIQAQAGNKIVPLTLHVADCATEQLEDDGAIEGMIEWSTLLRKLDKVGAPYRN